jgi:5-formyltetrahydrofolate cyclo-ligase
MPAAVHPYPTLDGVPDANDAEDVKVLVRQGIRSVRMARSAHRREEAEKALADVLETIPEVQQARCASVYVARESEPGTDTILERLAARGVRLLLPVLGAGLQRDWAEYSGQGDLVQRAPGRPREPGGTPLGAEALADADVIVVPALAVDSTGTRLGQGGGWYDRALAHARQGVLVIALTFPEEVYDADVRPLPREPHDRPVDAVATPAGWRRFTTPDAA